MKKDTTHTQCKMRHDSGLYDTSWIPTKFAVVGRRVGLKENGVWDDHWTVIEIFSTENSAMILERSQDWKQTRKASDI